MPLKLLQISKTEHLNIVNHKTHKIGNIKTETTEIAKWLLGALGVRRAGWIMGGGGRCMSCMGPHLSAFLRCGGDGGGGGARSTFGALAAAGAVGGAGFGGVRWGWRSSRSRGRLKLLRLLLLLGWGGRIVRQEGLEGHGWGLKIVPVLLLRLHLLSLHVSPPCQ